MANNYMSDGAIYSLYGRIDAKYLRMWIVVCELFCIFARYIYLNIGEAYYEHNHRVSEAQ